MEFIEQLINQQLPATRPSVIMFAAKPKPKEELVALALPMAGITEKDLEELKPEVEQLVPANNIENEFDSNAVREGFPEVETSSVEVNDTKNHVEIESDNETMDEDIPEETFWPREYKSRANKNLDVFNPSLDDLLLYATDNKPGSNVFDLKCAIGPDKFKLIQSYKSFEPVDLKEKAGQNKSVSNGRIKKSRASREKKYRMISRVRHNQLIFRIGHLVDENVELYNTLKNLVLEQHELTMNMAANGTETRIKQEAGVEEIAAYAYPGYLNVPDIKHYPINTDDVKVSPSIDVKPEPIKIEKIEETSEITLNKDPMNYADGEVPYATFTYTLVQE